MFKFMKSKKGFTLVELMIVVVIMAILVAVAVPIYSAVTRNARKKTCIANQREIISTINNWMMSSGETVAETKITIGTDADNKGTISTTSGTGLSEASFTAMFKTMPCCPADGGVIEVTFSCAAGGENAKIDTKCITPGVTDHVVPANS